MLLGMEQMDAVRNVLSEDQNPCTLSVIEMFCSQLLLL